MNRRPFDLAKLDFEGYDYADVRNYSYFNLLPVGVLMLITIKMLSLPILSGVAHMNCSPIPRMIVRSHDCNMT